MAATRKKTTTNGRRKKRNNSVHKRNTGADKIFALDIGTRSVIGIVAEKKGDDICILDTARCEHKTRSMLDGQIHDVPKVAEVIDTVKTQLEKGGAKLKNVSVAAAGRALYTMTAEAEMKVNSVITEAEQQQLDFLAVHNAQGKLAASHLLKDTSLYYCVGYSTVYYTLDGEKIKNLIGQRGKKATAQVIATFLPRQVVDSMRSALELTNLSIHGLTLEPIAAISVLIPSTMRHLNLVLVDIGAGTSDIAITRDGTIIAYGMVPMAGDEITEALSKKYLLDFNVAEKLKRQLNEAGTEPLTFSDILGMPYNLTREELVHGIEENIRILAAAIASEILKLNDEAPQAVMLVGGGALTPHLAQEVAQKLHIAENRVAVRVPGEIEHVVNIPENLRTPDAVTPLGILRTSSDHKLQFITVYVNDHDYSFFNFKEFSVTDALLNAGINPRKYNGKPGMGITVNINGETKLFSGTLGTLAKLYLDGKEAKLTDRIKDGSHITIERGEDGMAPSVCLCDIVVQKPSFQVLINGEETEVSCGVLVNGNSVAKDYVVQDQDKITYREQNDLAEVLHSAGYSTEEKIYHYNINGQDKIYRDVPILTVNSHSAQLSDVVQGNEEIVFSEPHGIMIKKLLEKEEMWQDSITVSFNDAPCKIERVNNVILNVNGRPADVTQQLRDGDTILYAAESKKKVMISDVLLNAGFTPPAPSAKLKFVILQNGAPAEFTSEVQEGDQIKIKFTPLQD